MVSEYLAGRGMQKKGIEVGTGLKEKDEEGMSPLVLSCRGEKTILTARYILVITNLPIQNL
jgi:hypothetical protein